MALIMKVNGIKWTVNNRNHHCWSNKII